MNLAFGLLFLVALGAMIVAGVMALWPSRRDRAQVIAGSAFIVAVGSIWAVVHFSEAEAKRAGFESASEQSAFKASGSASISEFREARAAREAAAAEAKAAARAAEVKAKEKAAAEAEARQKQEAEACRASISCWGDKHLVAASVRCKRAVESLAKYDHRWIDGAFDLKFPRYGWGDAAKERIRYVGDSIELQNGFGGWVRHNYVCVYAPTLDLVVDASVTPGRLPR